MKKIVLLAFILVLLSTAVIVWFVRPVVAQGTIYMRSDGSVDPPTANITSADNITYTFTDNIYDSIVVERDNIVIDGLGYTLQGTENGTVIDLTGIDLTGRSSITIKNMEIKGFRAGIYLYGSSNNAISGVNITNNDNGIWLEESSNNTLYGNNIMTNNWNGAHLYASSNNAIYGNNIINNDDGIYLNSSDYNRISGNNITANNDNGISLSSSSNNRIYHNNFVDNTYRVYSYNSTNFWDDGYPSGGNYWSDYPGVDLFSGAYQNEAGSDGIGDTPYVIDADNQDNYPLMGEKENKVFFEVSHGYWCGTDEDVVANVPYQRRQGWLFRIFNLEDETGQLVTNPSITVFTDREFVSLGPWEPTISDGEYDWDFPLELPEYMSIGAGANEPNYTDYSRPGFSAERSITPEILVESVTIQNFSLNFTLEEALPPDVNTIEIKLPGPINAFDEENLINYTVLSLNDVEDWSTGTPEGWTTTPSNVSIGKTYHFEATLETVKSPNLESNPTAKPGILIHYANWNELWTTIGTGSSATVTHPEGPTVTFSADGEYEWYAGISYSRQDFFFNQVIGPVASFTYSPSASYTGETVIFNASASYDPDGNVANYTWNFDDGNITTVSQPVINHTYAKPGTYNVTLTVKDATGSESTHYITVTVLTDEVIREPRSVHVVAAVGAAVTTTTALLASLGRSFNSFISKLPIPNQLKQFLKFYGKKLFETVDKVKLEALEKAPFITKGELVALGISALITTIVFGFVEANGIPRFLNPSVLAAVIPSTLISVCLVKIAGVIFEAFCARTCRVYRQFSLWMYGIAAFLISGLLLLFPFSSPGITRYQSGKISNKTKGLLILSKMLILLTLTIPFAGLFMLGFKIIGDAGLLLTLMIVSYSLVPLKPLAGKAVFDYRKEVSLIALVSAGILFYSCTINLLPHVTYLAVGIVSVFLAAITLNQLRKTHPK